MSKQYIARRKVYNTTRADVEDALTHSTHPGLIIGADVINRDRCSFFITDDLGRNYGYIERIGLGYWLYCSPDGITFRRKLLADIIDKLQTQ